jgi:CRP-like cAMP-binding protein
MAASMPAPHSFDQRRQPVRWRNQFLGMVPERDRALLLPHLQETALRLNATLCEDGDLYEYIYFPTSGMVSLVIDMSDGRSAETAMIGYDSGVGLIAGLCNVEASGRAIVQLPGSALKMSAAHFRSAAEQSVAIRELIVKFENVLQSEIKQTVACNALHGLNGRLCTWLLRSHDLCRGEMILLTQEYLAQMLAVRRTTVTIVARLLQSSGIIRYTRGRISVVDRKALEGQACECYQVMRERKQTLFSDLG